MQQETDHLLDRTQVEYAIAMLRAESGDSPTPAQWHRFRWYEWSFWISLLAAVSVVAVALWEKGEPTVRSALFSWGWAIWLLSLCTLVVALVLCWPLLGAAWRLYRQMLKNGMWALLGRTVPRWRRRLAWVALATAAPFLLIILLFFLLFPFTAPLLLTSPGYVLIWRVRRRLKLLESVPDLIRLLEQRLAAQPGEAIRVPGDQFRKISHLEEARVRRLRTEALKPRPPLPSGYAIVRSPALVDETSRLDPDTRLRVESRLLELTTSPEQGQPGGGQADTRRLPVPETTLEIVYRLEEPEHQIEVLALSRRHGEEASAPRGAGNG